MSISSFLLPLALTGTVCACAAPRSTADGASETAALFAADRAFCEDTSVRRLEGWMSWFHPNAAKVPIEGEVAQGHAAIREQSASLFADPNIGLRWDPEVGATVLQGELGFTRGRYELVRFPADESSTETVLSTGTYLTVWCWMQEGWRVALDTGVSDKD